MPGGPHDSFFKELFEDPRNAAGELRTLLDPDVVARLDLDTLRVEPGSFRDEHLAASESDLLFSVQLAGSSTRVLLYVLFEHQSSVDALIVLRLLKYLVRVWERHAQQRGCRCRSSCRSCSFTVRASGPRPRDCRI